MAPLGKLDRKENRRVVRHLLFGCAPGRQIARELWRGEEPAEIDLTAIAMKVWRRARDSLTREVHRLGSDSSPLRPQRLHHPLELLLELGIVLLPAGEVGGEALTDLDGLGVPSRDGAGYLSPPSRTRSGRDRAW